MFFLVPNSLMNKNYYLIGSVLGVLTAFVILIIARGSDGVTLISWSQNYNGFIPSLIGVMTALGLGYFFDRKSVPPIFINQAFLIPLFILICASIMGGFTNYYMNGYPNFFFDYFTRPIWVMGLFGFPATIVVGMAWKFINTQLAK